MDAFIPEEMKKRQEKLYLSAYKKLLKVTPTAVVCTQLGSIKRRLTEGFVRCDRYKIISDIERHLSFMILQQ